MVAIVKVVAIMVSNGLDGQKPVELNQRVKKSEIREFYFPWQVKLGVRMLNLAKKKGLAIS